jgi:hypothetical protein
MSKFNQTATKPAVGASPVITEATASGATYEGAAGFARDAKGELFLLAVSNMVEGTFYEQVGDRDARCAALVHQVAVVDAEWTLGFLRWLRGEGNMRSASLVGAAEAVKARLDAAQAGREIGNGARNRQMVDAVLQRADEPGELLAYWTSRHGRAIPKPVKRGIGDAVRRLYSERALLKYDTASHGFRFGDVLDLTHPAPAAPWQGDLFSHALDRRHNRPWAVDADTLPMVAFNATLRELAVEDPRRLLDAEKLRRAGMTWEDALSLVGSKVDKRALWEALIPSMGYMALLRNLRNFDQAGVSDHVAAMVAARLADPEQVARSRQFPFRFLAAYRNVPSLRWGHALDRALTASLANLPVLAGRTLVLADRSGSMFGRMSDRSELDFADSAAIFGTALAMRNLGLVTLAEFGTGSAEVSVGRGESLLKVLDRFHNLGGTQTAEAVRRHYAGHDRVVIVTDEQAWAGYGQPGDAVPAQVPVYTFNLVGYRHGHQAGGPNRVTIGGGLTDHAFRLIPLLEAGKAGSWPWIDQPTG